nr:putative disease resistance protein rpp1 [Quercus suber]
MGLQQATSLRNLNIWNCSSLTTLPEWICEIISLQSLDISNCPNFTSLPALTSLQSLDISSCPNFTSLPALTSLQFLHIWACPNLTSLPALTSLKTLEILSCPILLHQKKKIQNKVGALPKFLGVAVVQQVNSSVVNNFNYLEVRIINCADKEIILVGRSISGRRISLCRTSGCLLAFSLNSNTTEGKMLRNDLRQLISLRLKLNVEGSIVTP